MDKHEYALFEQQLYYRGGRDFSLNFEVCAGECEFTLYFVRIAGSLCHGWSAMPVYYLMKN